MTAKEYFLSITDKYPIDIPFSAIKKFSPSQWKKTQQQIPEFHKLERLVRLEKENLKQRFKKFQK